MSDRVVRVVFSADASDLRRESSSAAGALAKVGKAGEASGKQVDSSVRAMGNSFSSLIKDLRGATTAAQNLGKTGSDSAKKVDSSVKGIGSSFSSGLGKLTAFATGIAATVGAFQAVKAGIKSTFTLGMDFQSMLNQFGAVASISGAALDKVGAKARQLGSDIDLPTASASDAAAAMLELAKGGLSVQASMDAAKGTLQLAAAAQIDGATAATIQSSALNTFGLSADKAGHVADVLANTANAASGEITDFAQGLQQSGSVAAGFGISLDDTATVLGLFASNGIKGSDAGTSFKTMLTQLAAPTKQAQAAMDVLQLSVYDTNGQFVGARSLTDQLAKAQGRLTQEQFNAAAATVFGTDAIRGANILAKGGVTAFDSLSVSIGKTGGAQTVAAAQTKGLKGALGLVKNAVQDVQLNAFDKLAPGVEKAVRGVAASIPGIAEVVIPVFGHIVDNATQFFGQLGDVFKGFGPQNVSAVLQGGASIGTAVSDALKAAFSPASLHIIGKFAGDALTSLLGLAKSITTAAGKFFGPIVTGAASLIERASPYVTRFVDIIKGTITEITPLGKTIGDFFTNLASNGTLDNIGGFFTGLASAVKGVAGVVVPALGGILGVLGKLGPVANTGVVALGAMLLLRGPLVGFFGQIQARAAAAAVSLAASTGIAGAAGAAVGGLSRVAGFLAGPWGLAIGVGVAALFAFASGSKDAVITTGDFSAAIDDQTGKLNDNASAVASKALADDGALNRAKNAGVETGIFTAAVLGNKDAFNQSKDAIAAHAVEILKAGGATEDGANYFELYKKQAADAGLSLQDYTRKVLESGDARKQFAGIADFKNIDDPKDIQSATLAYSVLIEEQKKFALQQATTNSAIAAKASADKIAADSAEKYVLSLKSQSGGVKLLGTNTGDLTLANEAATISAANLSGAFTRGSGGVKVLGTNTGDLSLATEAASISALSAGGSFDLFGEKAKTAAFKTDKFYTIVKGKNEGDPDKPVTKLSLAFDRYNTAVSDADTTTQLFMFTADKLAGRNVSVEAALSANAAAARSIGKALRDAAGDSDAYAAAQQKLKDDQAHLNDGTDSATTAADIAADQRAVADAFDQTKDSVDRTNDSYRAYEKTALLRVTQVATDTAKTQGFATAVKASKKELEAQRAAFIAQQPAADIASGAAAKLADQYGLIPDKILTLLLADPKLAVQAAAEAKKAFDLATKKRTAKLDADIASGKAKAAELKKLGIDATIDKSGKLIFLTKEGEQRAAALLAAAKEAVKNRGGELTITAIDQATTAITGIMTTLASIQDKTVQLNIATAVNSLPTDLRTSGAAIAAGFAANGGKANGGMVYGPGTGTSDSVLTALSNGEGVNTAAAMAKAPNRRAMDFMNAGGTIPGFATGGIVGSLKVKATTSGNGAGDALAEVSSLFGQVTTAVGTANAAAAAAATAAKAAAAAAAAAIPKANSGGTEQWRALATRVAFAHNENIASVQVMLNQMSRESGGNPAAINLTDINAQNGTPSKGLLQFIDPTFRSYADPGFNSNIYDPESQMRAWYNYINARYGGYAKFAGRGYGAYATGGRVFGPGGGRSDSILARLSNGEGVNTADAMSKPSNVGAMNFMNAGGVVPGFAGGGIAGSTPLGLSGRSPAQLGESANNVAQALIDIATAVSNARSAAIEKRTAANDAARRVTDAKSSLGSARESQNENVRAAQAARRDVVAKQALADVAAQKRVDAAKTKATKDAAVAAQSRLNATQAIQLSAADRALQKVKATESAKVESARRELVAAVALRASTAKVADAYAATSRAAAATQKAMQGVYQRQQAYAAQIDTLKGKLSNATDKLSGLRSDRASLASGISSTVAGFDGGITGHSDTRTTFDTILKGQQYNRAQEEKFNADITKLRNLGLSSASLQSIAGAGIDGGGATAAALASASKGQIAKLNATTGAITNTANNIGNTVAGQFYDAGIQAAVGLVNGLKSQIGSIQKVMNTVAATAVASLTGALKIHSPSQVFHELGDHTVQGFINGVAGGKPAVAKALDNMVAVPDLAAVRSIGGGRSSAPVISISLGSSDPLTAAVAQMMEVRINGVQIDIRDSFRNRQAQPR